ncbi:minor tail protein [Rhodococcus phage MacGully]|nr:minor tail protein [Rhodococcus phage MacGully]
MAEQTVQQAVAKLILRWDGDALDYESERRAFIEVTNGVGELHLPRGPKGDKGLDGEPGPGFAPDVVWQYATDAEALAHLPTGFGPLDRGYCIVNDPTNTGFFWSGSEWLPVQDVVGAEGPQGPPIGVSVGTVTTSPSGGSAVVSLDPASTATNKIFNFTLPRGAQGAVGLGQKGDPGDALSNAADVLWPEDGPLDGQALIWDDQINKARWGMFTPGPVGPFSIGPNEVAAVNDNSWPNDYKVIGQIDVPAQDFAWHPRVYGYIDVKVNGIMARVDVEVRLNSASGSVVGRGPGTQITGFLENYTTRTVTPSFEGPMTPTTSAQSVAAGATATLYVVIRRIDTLATFGVQTRKDRASFAVYCDPIPGSI